MFVEPTNLLPVFGSLLPDCVAVRVQKSYLRRRDSELQAQEVFQQLAGAQADRGGRRCRPGIPAAVQLCPGDAAAWRELAGVRFLRSRWAEAATFVERSVRLDPADEQAWNLLATSRFLNDEPDAALDAWNRIGRPRVDPIRVEGVRRTRHTVIGAIVDLTPRTVLTAAKQRRAARRFLGRLASPLAGLPMLESRQLTEPSSPDPLAPGTYGD